MIELLRPAVMPFILIGGNVVGVYMLYGLWKCLTNRSGEGGWLFFTPFWLYVPSLFTEEGNKYRRSLLYVLFGWALIVVACLFIFEPLAYFREHCPGGRDRSWLAFFFFICDS